MTKINIKKIEDKNKNVPINSAENRIEQIKMDILETKTEPCKVPVWDMWDEVPN